MEASINIDTTVQRSFSSGAGEAVRWMSGVALIICDTLSDWLERNRQRRQLMSLPDQVLGDIGVSRAGVYKECEKPFWRA
jgi:uncharacterized protein YjiS (DUF1127 family)